MGWDGRLVIAPVDTRRSMGHSDRSVFVTATGPSIRVTPRPTDGNKITKSPPRKKAIKVNLFSSTKSSALVFVSFSLPLIFTIIPKSNSLITYHRSAEVFTMADADIGNLAKDASSCIAASVWLLRVRKFINDTLPPHNVPPLLTVMDVVVPLFPNPKAIPHLWSYTSCGCFLQAGDFLAAKEAGGVY